jgi:hypothetical protein
MLNNSFATAKDYTRTVDLSVQEIFALDELGVRLGLEPELSKTFTTLIKNGDGYHDTPWSHKDDQYKDVSLMDISLYEKLDDGVGFDRVPKVNFTYWKEDQSGTKTIILDVDFLPAYYLQTSPENPNAMIARIKTLPGADETFDCPMIRQVATWLSGNQPGPMLSGTPANNTPDTGRKPS